MLVLEGIWLSVCSFRYYDPGNSVNYQISAPTSSSTTSSSRCTVTVTTTMALKLMPRMPEITGVF